MCTVTWLAVDGRRHLIANRDELRARLPAEPPRLRELDGVRYLAPTDGKAGGTWVLVNEHGLAITLLNAHPPGWRSRGGMTSRGALVRSLAVCADRAEIARRLAAATLGGYRPFTLLALGLEGEARRFDWDGERLTDGMECGDRFLTSSSYDSERIAADRRAEHAARLPTGAGVADHLAFHRLHRPARGPGSPCMHRDDARTVSCSWIELGDEGSTFRYAPGPPCTTEFGEPLTLECRAVAAASRAGAGEGDDG